MGYYFVSSCLIQIVFYNIIWITSGCKKKKRDQWEHVLFCLLVSECVYGYNVYAVVYTQGLWKLDDENTLSN